MAKTDEENARLCEGCTLCCESITIEIEKPDTKKDIDEIIWHLLHENVNVFFNNAGWFVEIKTRCKALNGNGKCDIYISRPDICRKYSQESCEKYGEGEYYKKIFRNKDEFLGYVGKNPKLKKLFKKKTTKRQSPAQLLGHDSLK